MSIPLRYHFWTCHKCKGDNLRGDKNEFCLKCKTKRQNRRVWIEGCSISYEAWTCELCNVDDKNNRKVCKVCGHKHDLDLFLSVNRYDFGFSPAHDRDHLLRNDSRGSESDLRNLCENPRQKCAEDKSKKRSGSESDLKKLFEAECPDIKLVKPKVERDQLYRNSDQKYREKRDLHQQTLSEQNCSEQRLSKQWSPEQKGTHIERKELEQKHSAQKHSTYNLRDPVSKCQEQKSESESKDSGARPKTRKSSYVCKCAKDICEGCKKLKHKTKVPLQQQTMESSIFSVYTKKEQQQIPCMKLYIPNDSDKPGIHPDSQKTPTSELKTFLTVECWYCKICMIQVETKECSKCQKPKSEAEFSVPHNEFLNNSTKL